MKYIKTGGGYISEDGKYRIEGSGKNWYVFEIGVGFVSSARSLKDGKWIVDHRMAEPPAKYIDYWGESYS